MRRLSSHCLSMTIIKVSSTTEAIAVASVGHDIFYPNCARSELKLQDSVDNDPQHQTMNLTLPFCVLMTFIRHCIGLALILASSRGVLHHTGYRFCRV